MKFKIWHKMIIGISIPSLIAIAGGILTYGYIGDVNNRQSFVLIADDLKEKVLEARRIEKNFIQLKSSYYRESLINAINSLTVSISNLSSETSGSDESLDIISLSDIAKQYIESLSRLDASFANEKSVTDRVNKEGKHLESIVDKIQSSKELTTDFILRLRLLEKNYIFYRNHESLLELKQGISQIKNLTPFCNECSPYIDSINTLFYVFSKSDMHINQLQSLGISMEEITAKVSSAERAKIASFINDSQNLLLAALGLLFILGPWFVYKTASKIVAPINRLSKITKKISEGEISLRAPFKEHDETYSLALSFNSMLDNLQKTQHSLTESLQLLNEKQAQLVESEKRASMGFLVAGVAHEINNPLNNISLTAESVMENINDLTVDELNDYIKDIRIQSERAHNIVDNLLDFARARKSSIMEKQDVAVIVSESLNLVSNQLRVSNIKIEKEIPDKPCYVNGNRSKIEQILISIITNAVQAMNSSGILGVKVHTDLENSSAIISISDNGKGIPQEDIKNIFEPFFTTKAPGDGTGLGLAVSHTLITEHHGEISVESKEGEGTTFTIRLPLY